MDQHKRMYKTLGCLAGAMTGTASLLAWIDPSPSLGTLSQHELAIHARSLVFDDVPLRAGQWRQVDIVEGPALHRPGVILAAGGDRSESHFYIDEGGRLFRTHRWDRQLPPSNAPHTIRVGIVQVDARPSLSSAQADSIGALLDALNEAVWEQRPL